MIAKKMALASAAACALGLTVVSEVDASAFTSGSLVVAQVGVGTAALANTANPVVLKEYLTSGGAPLQTISLPSTATGSGNRALTLSGSAASEGFLTLSGNSQYLMIGGYNATTGAANPSAVAASVNARVIGRIDGNGVVDTTTALTANAFDGSNIRSVASTDGTNIWAAGNAGSGLGATAGVQYLTYGSSSSTRVNTGAGTGSNRRVVNIFGGQLYSSASSTPSLSINAVGTGLPTAAGAAETTLSGLPISGTHSNYDYWFMNSSTLYIADDGSAANGGGIQKWTLSAGTWSLAYTLLNNGTTNTATRGLAGTVNGSGQAVLYATTTATTANTLITVTDTGASATASVLATAATNTAFRGVDFSPVVLQNVISLTSAPTGTNYADNTNVSENPGSTTAGAIHVTGTGSGFQSEIDGLTSNQNAGSANVDNDLGGNTPVYVMLWTTGSLTNGLVPTNGTLVTSGSDYTDLQNVFGSFNYLVRFTTNSFSGGAGAVNWNFAADSGVQLDRIAVVPEPVAASMLGLTSAMMITSRRRRQVA